jgi:PEP-CTERM motif
MLSIRANLISAFGIVFLSVLSMPQTANADPVTITSGSVGVTSNIRDIIFFNFSGNGLSVEGLNNHASNTQYMSPCLQSASRCRPGDLISPTALTRLSSEPGSPTSVTFNGRSVRVSWASNDSFLQFTGAGVVIPNSADPITLTIPFDLVGTINVHPLDDPGSVIFSTTITGSGIATLTLRHPGGNQQAGLAIDTARYDFRPTPVPEPATVILLSTGLAGIVVRKCRKGRRSKQS